MRRAAILLLALLLSGAVAQARVSTPGVTGGGSLPLAEVLRESCFHATFSNRARSLAVRVGPR